MLIGETPIGELPGIGDSFLTMSETYDMDLWLVFTGSEPLEGGGIRYHLERQHDICLKKTLFEPYDNFLCVGKVASKSFQIDTGLRKILNSAYFDIILRPSYEATFPSTPVISALVWSYAEILDAVWRQLDTIATALKLEHAQGNDLDNAWGKIYDLPRLVSEDDTQYRDRLKTRTRILNCSGTKTNCESIIDSIIGEKCASNVNTRYPSHVRITFVDDNYTKIAISKKATLDIIIPQMLAAGVSYDLILPLIEYDMNILMNGAQWIPFFMHYALKRKNNNITPEFYITSILRYIIPQEILIAAKKYFDSDYLVSTNIQTIFLIDHIISAGLLGHVLKTLPSNVVMSKLKILNQYIMKSYVNKNNATKTFTVDQISKITKKRFCSFESSVTSQNILPYELDILIMLFSKSAEFNILTKRTFPKRSTMRLTLIGA